MLSSMASSVSGGDDSPDTHHHMKSDPPELDYEGPSSHIVPEETNGNNIPKLIANDTPTRNRRKRRKGIPTRVAPTVIHNDNDSSSDDALPPFLLPSSPARVTPKDLSGGSEGFCEVPVTPRQVDTVAPNRASLTPDPATSSSTVNQKPASTTRTPPRSRRSSTNNKILPPKRPIVPVPMSAEDGTVSGMVFGYTKMTSSITTTSRGAKRIKLTVYMCNFCNFKTADNTAFWEHNVQHLFTCPHCSHKAFNRQNLVSHMVREHPGQVPEEYTNIRAISVIDMQVTHNVTSNPPPPGRATRLEHTPGFMSSHLDESHGSGNETPPKLVNSSNAPKMADCVPPKAHSKGQKPTDLKFRCDFCPYITSIFSAFMNHQSEHTSEVEKRTKTSPSTSGKLKSLLVGRSLSPTPLVKPEMSLLKTPSHGSVQTSLPLPVSSAPLPNVTPSALANALPLQVTPLSLQKASPLQTTPTPLIKTSSLQPSPLALQKTVPVQTSPLALPKAVPYALSPGKKRQPAPYIPKPKYPPGQCIKPSNPPVLKVPQPLTKSTTPVPMSAAAQVSPPAPVANTKSDSEPASHTPLQNELSKHAKCPICSFVLRSLVELESHINLCHKSKLTVTGGTTGDSCKNNSGDYTWCCIYCTSKSETKQGVVTHIKAQHPGEKIRVWRWANKSSSPPLDAETAPPQNTVKSEPSSNASDTEDSSLILKQIVSSTIDNVYGSTFGDPPQTSPLGLATSKSIGMSQSMLKIPDITNTTDIMEGKCAITVRKVTQGSMPGSASRQMISLITGGLVTSPSKPACSFTPTVSPSSGPSDIKVSKALDPGKCAGSMLGSDSMHDLCLQPPLLTPSYLDMLPDSSETQEREIDLSMKKSTICKVVDMIKMEPASPASDTSNELDYRFLRENDDLTDLSNLDVDVEVRKESLIPTDHISFDEDQRLHCCRHCTYQTKSYGHIIDHISTHTGMKTWSCSYCAYRSNRRHDLLRHVQKNHPGSKLKMIRNVPYSTKFSYPLKMSQRVSAARSMVAKKRTAPGRKHQSSKQRMLKKGLLIRPETLSPTKVKSPTTIEKWQPPPTVEFWECPICTRRGSMDVMERHIPTVHPEKLKKAISKKEIMAPSNDHLVMSATFSERRNLHIDMVPLQNIPFVSKDSGDLHLLKGLDIKLALVPEILTEYETVKENDIILGKELEAQRLQEMQQEIVWLSLINGNHSVSQDSDNESTDSSMMCTTAHEEYRCQYCHFADQSLYTIRKHLLWQHPGLLLKCVDLRAKLPLSPRVVHMCHCCTFHSVSLADLLSHYTRNPKHGPEQDSDNASDDDHLPKLQIAGADQVSAKASNDDSLPELQKRPVSRRVAMKRVTKSSKNFLRFKFVHGTQLQCRYCKDFRMYDSMIMKDHLLTEHYGQPAVAIDIRSRELRRTSRVFFCPILECNFTEYGPDALVKHLNRSHPDSSFDTLIIQICPKDTRTTTDKNTVSTVPPVPPLLPKVDSSKSKTHTKKDHHHHHHHHHHLKRDKKTIYKGDIGDDIYTGGSMPKTTSALTLKNRYWCVYCDAHSSSIDNVKGHFLENHMENKAQLIDARARILRKKSRLFFCWNVTCNFTTFLEQEATLHEQSQACLNNFAPDEEGKAGEYDSTKVDSHSSGLSSSAGTPEHSNPSTSSGASRMFQCLYCSLMMSSRVNMRSHMVTEHACPNGGYSEINTDFNKDGDIVMNVGGATESDTTADD